MRQDIDRFIKLCDTCMKFDKVPIKNHPALVLPITGIFDRIGIDLCFGFPVTTEGYIGILVIVEALTKFPFVFPIKSKTMEEISSCLISYISIFGPPKEILSDRGKEFINKLVDGICERLSINRRITSAYNPRSNGLTERFNQTLVNALRKQASEQPEKWVDYLPFVLMAYRTRIHSSTNFSPFELMFGRKMTNFDNWTSANDEEVSALLKRSVEIKQHTENTVPLALENIKASQKKQANTQNKQNNVELDEPNILEKNDTVYVRSEKIQNKFEPIYNGPYYIEKITNSGNYILRDSSNDVLTDSFPRWRLKLQKNFDTNTNTDNKSKYNVDDSKYYDIETILDHKKIGRGYKYLVKWKGEPSSKNSWIPGSYFLSKEVLDEYHSNQSNKTSKRINSKIS